MMRFHTAIKEIRISYGASKPQGLALPVSSTLVNNRSPTSARADLRLLMLPQL